MRSFLPSLERLQDFSAYWMVDLYGNEYATLEWEEVRNMTWRENPIIVSANPAPTTKPEDTAFFDTQMTKVEIRALLQEQKQTLKATWSSCTYDSKIEDGAMSVPPNFKKSTIQDRKIVLQQPKQVRPKDPGKFYDGDLKMQRRLIWLSLDRNQNRHGLPHIRPQMRRSLYS